MFANLKNFFTQLNDVPAMAKIDQVKLNVPADSVYVTLAAALVVQQSSELMQLGFHTNLPVIAVADRESEPMEVCYVLHNNHDFKLIRQEREIFSTPLSSIVKLNRFDKGGFVLHLADGRGVALSTPIPVQTDATTHFNTIHGITDMTGGWLKELEPNGVLVVA